jgi:soluble lytic murein transglycosylase-like protein
MLSQDVGVSVRRLVAVSLAVAAASALVACGDSRHSGSPSTSTVAQSARHSGSPSTSTVAQSAPPAQNATLPSTPKALSRRLVAVDSALRRAIHAWRARGQPEGAPPRGVARRAKYVERALRLLARRPGIEAATVHRLPSRLAYEASEVAAALRDLGRLSAGWPAHRVALGPPEPLDRLLRYYRSAQRRFGVRWQILAAVNLVESDFGRVRNPSVAGAQGPMQFMPSTWRAYGLGGDIKDPHDAIIGAANLLRHAGAPANYARALYAYNPSPAYVDAVRRYARLIERDRDAMYYLYSWRP